MARPAPAFTNPTFSSIATYCCSPFRQF